MVRRPRRGSSTGLSAAIALAMALVACSPGGQAVTTTTFPPTTLSTPLTTATVPTPTTTTVTTTVPVEETSTSTSTSTSTTVSGATLPEIDAEVMVPDGNGPFPAVVLVHGGGWVAGEPSLMRGLASYLTDVGYLTVNTSYALAGETPGYPAAVDDVACAVRYAAAHPSSDGTVVALGHSAGAHLAAVVALDGGRYALGCPVTGSGVPDRLVGLAGPYDVSRLGVLMYPFFGAGPAQDPEAWAAGNPMTLVDLNPALDSLLMYGEEDGFVAPSFTLDFASALTGAGSQVLVEAVEGARHNDMYQPEVVGDLIAAWLD